MDVHQNDLLFGKIALNKRLITRDLLNRALHYQRTQAPDKQLGEILLEKGVLSREQVDEILAFQHRVNQIKLSQTGASQSAMFSAAGLGVTPAPNTLWAPTPAPMAPMSPMGPMGGPMAAATAPTARHAMGAVADPLAGGPAPVNNYFNGSTAVALGPTPNPEQDPLIGEVVGGCTINAKIGQGGMGAIYLAHHEALRKDVVVKILPPESAANPRTVERFFREARAAAKLEHPNIVHVQDVGTTERNLHYIIMQYIDGQNLEERIQAQGRHAPLDSVRVILEIARGLQAAHRSGVIHRDIKAENILITQQGMAKITDFGLAKDLNSELKLTADGAMIGTPLYMAPEIGREKEIDGRVDIYSLGVTYYYLLTGVQPFRGFSALEILSAKAHDKIKPPEEIFPEIPEEHRRVCGKMLEKKRDDRYKDVDALIRDLEALDRGFPIDAGEPSIWPHRGAPGDPPAKDKDKDKDKDKKGGKQGKSGGAQPTTKGAGGVAGTGLSPLVIAAFGGVLLLIFVLAIVLVVVLFK